MNRKMGPRGRTGVPTITKDPAKLRMALRRSKSSSDLVTSSALSSVPPAVQRKPISDRNGLNFPVHPLLPLKKDKENMSLSGRATLGIKRAATVPNTISKKPKPDAESSAKPVASKKIPLYDYKARFNDLLEKHKPMKAEYLELKRKDDELSEELEELRTEAEKFSQTVAGYKNTIKDKECVISELKDKYKIVKDMYEGVQSENFVLNEKLSSMETDLHTTEKKLSLVEEKYNILAEKMEQKVQIMEHYERMISKQREEIEDLQESTQQLHWERRSLHNKLQDLKGNIRVIFRVRPAISVGRTVALMNFPDACTIEMERLEPGATKRLAKHDFKFDRVFGPMSTQEDVWEEVSCLIQSALDGYNVCIFAYGQTGSGKTYTMEGSKEDPGVIPRCCTMVFDSIKQLSKSGWNYTVHASFLEIYNEQLFDLLDPGRDPRELDIRMADAKGTDVYVTNLSELEVQSAVDLLRLAARAQMNRQTAATAGNERSSRSHSVARVRLIATHAARALTLTSRICLVDLAGSESAKTTQRLAETKNINRSLSELGQVILALQQKQEHIPFRNSKLTRLLEPQLGGAAKALLVAAAAPYEDCSHESLSTLRFATKVGHCSTAAARRNLALAQPMVAQSKDC